MAYYLTKPCSIQSNKVLYYSGLSHWTDNSANKETYKTKAQANAVIDNSDNLNGGFKNATVVKA